MNEYQQLCVKYDAFRKLLEGVGLTCWLFNDVLETAKKELIGATFTVYGPSNYFGNQFRRDCVLFIHSNAQQLANDIIVLYCEHKKHNPIREECEWYD